MAQTYSDYEVQDDGGEGAYIAPFAAFIAKWPVDEWKRLPGNQEEVVWNSVDELIGIYGNIFADSDDYTPVIRRVREEIHLTMKINFEHPDIHGSNYMVMPDEYREALQNIDSIIDDRRDQFQGYLTEYFKKNGQMDAAANIPKPSVEPSALPKPSPIASTKGTVTGPVVTPAESQPTFTNSSVDSKVRKRPKV